MLRRASQPKKYVLARQYLVLRYLIKRNTTKTRHKVLCLYVYFFILINFLGNAYPDGFKAGYALQLFKVEQLYIGRE